MQILYLAHRIPYPPNKGDKIRSYHELRHLAERHTVDLGCLCDDAEDFKHVAVLEKMCRRVCVVPLRPEKAKIRAALCLVGRKPLSVGYFYDTRLQRRIDAWVGSQHYDAVLCFSSPMAEYLFRSQGKPRLWNGSKPPRKVMDFCDLDSDKWAQYARETAFPWNVLYRFESRRLFTYETMIHEAFEASIFISVKERDLFRRKHSNGDDPFVVSNGVDVEYFAPEGDFGGHVGENKMPQWIEAGRPMVVFVGAMDYYANVDGVLWFTHNVWPTVRSVFPKATFVIVGSRPDGAVQKLHGFEGVHVTGFVPDVRPYLHAASCSVAPLRLARGIQNKVLEAMAMEKAVVATPQALEGIAAVPGRDVLSAHTADAFAEAVVKLLGDKSLRDRLGQNARRYVLQRHSWPAEMAALENILLHPNKLIPQ